MDMKLIELVETHDILYDKSSANFKDNRRKQKIWENIAIMLNKDAATVQRRWKVLRDRYTKERREISSVASGAAASSSASSWEFYAAMAFLDPHVKCRNTSGNVSFRDSDINKPQTVSTDSESIFSPTLSEDCIIEYGEHSITSPVMSPTLIEPSTSAIREEEITLTPTTPAAQSSSRGKKRKGDDEVSDIDDTLSSISNYFKNKRSEDSDLSFGHYVGLELKKLTSRKKNEAKMKILNIFAELEENTD